MHVIANVEPGLVLAAIEGRFDVHGMEQFESAVLQRVSVDHPSVIIDLSGVEFMDSSALSGLVRTLKRTMFHGGSIVLVDISAAARIILELTRLDEVLPHVESVEAARQHVLQAV